MLGTRFLARQEYSDLQHHPINCCHLVKASLTMLGSIHERQNNRQLGKYMIVQRSTLAWVYGVVAVLAFIGTWGNNIHYMTSGLSPLDVNILFWKETFANPASRSITVDILFLSIPVTIWMMMEARRLQMRGIWFYLLGSVFIAVSMTVPLFMALRERKLAETQPEAGTLSVVEIIWALMLGVVVIAYTARSLAL